MPVSISKCVWFTTVSLFDVRYAIATAPIKILDKVAMTTKSPAGGSINKKIKKRNVLHNK